MRYSKDHKQQARQQLLNQSGSHAKKHGFSASGVDALAGAAGVTSGSFYKHFASKNALFSTLVKAELEQTISRFATIKPGDREALLTALSSYLSLGHVHAPENGCPVPSLAAEVARGNDAVRTTFEAGMVDFKKVLGDITASDDTAWTLIAQNVGAVMIARAMCNDSVRQEVLDAVRTSGAQLLARSPGA